MYISRGTFPISCLEALRDLRKPMSVGRSQTNQEQSGLKSVHKGLERKGAKFEVLVKTEQVHPPPGFIFRLQGSLDPRLDVGFFTC